MLAVVAGFVFVGVTSANAVSLSGRFGVWSYLRDDSVDHVQVVPLLSVNLRNLDKGGAWSFESTLRGYADYQNGWADASSALRVHRALLIWKPKTKPWEVRAGQQWVYEGVARGNVTGLWAGYKPCSAGEVHVFAGSRIPSSLNLTEENPDGGVAAGISLQRRFGKRLFKLSYYYVGKDGDVLYNGAGLDYACTAITDVTMRVRLHFNLEQSNIETGQVSAFWQTNDRLLLSLDARTETPRIFEDSYFTRFLEDVSTNAVRGGAQYLVYQQLYVTGMGYAVFTEEDLLYKARAGVGCKMMEFGYTHWLAADKGDMDGFYGEIRHDYRTFEGRAGFDYSRGSNSEIRPNTESQVIFGGLQWSPCNKSTLGARIEHLKDPAHSEDWRALFSLVTTFRSKVRSGS